MSTASKHAFPGSGLPTGDLYVFAFLGTAVAISLSGVMAPGPVTAATLAAGTRHRHAGAWIALGHLVVELPLILLLVAGLSRLLQSEGAQVGIGLAGGAFLLLMGTQLLLSVRADGIAVQAVPQRHPFWSGVVLTGANPYFLLWWATVGMALATRAVELGAIAFVLFALVHWLCDLGWLEALSLASFKGTEVFGPRSLKIVSAVCGACLFVFGIKFVWDAGTRLTGWQ
jgi:threonine/homoserine/homoserine lactone efflux protein